MRRDRGYDPTCVGSYAAAVGGDTCVVRGCLILLLLLGLAAPVNAQSIDVPSGASITLHEVLYDTTDIGGPVMRFRFLAPEISRDGGSLNYEAVEDDFMSLCETVVIPAMSEAEDNTARVIISFSDRVVEFGSSDPDATQFFEGFRIEDAACIWEVF